MQAAPPPPSRAPCHSIELTQQAAAAPNGSPLPPWRQKRGPQRQDQSGAHCKYPPPWGGRWACELIAPVKEAEGGCERPRLLSEAQAMLHPRGAGVRSSGPKAAAAEGIHRTGPALMPA